jgi:hypothetical protein
MINHRMTEDREVDLWREQWSGVAPLSPEFLRQVQNRIKVQDRRFWLGNLLAMAALVGTLILAFYQLSHYTSRFEKGQATGVCVLLLVAVTCRLWLMRGTWRAETQLLCKLRFAVPGFERPLFAAKVPRKRESTVVGWCFARRLRRPIGRPSGSNSWAIPPCTSQ